MLKKFISAAEHMAVFEATEQDDTATRFTLANLPLIQILAELKTSKEKNGSMVEAALIEIDNRHTPLVRAKESEYKFALNEIAREETALKSDINFGRYSSQPAHEATILELKQRAIEAEADLLRVKEEAAGAKAVFLRSVVNGSNGSGANVAGVDWLMFINLTKALLTEFENQTMGQDLTERFFQEYQRANDEAVSYQNAQAGIKAKLDQFKDAARSRYSGSLNPSHAQIGNPAATPTPARRPGDWGQSGNPIPPQYMSLGGQK